MILSDPLPTESARRAVLAFENTNNEMISVVKSAVMAAHQQFWNHPLGVTPSQILAEMGARAAAALGRQYDTVEFLVKVGEITPEEMAALTPPAKITIAADGSATVST